MYLCMSLCMSGGVGGLGSSNFLFLILLAVSLFHERHFELLFSMKSTTQRRISNFPKYFLFDQILAIPLTFLCDLCLVLVQNLHSKVYCVVNTAEVTQLSAVLRNT